MQKQIIDKDVVAALLAHGVDVNDVLRKALKVNDQDWVCKGVVFPAGTFFRTWFKDRPYWGIVRDGALYIKDQRFASPSAAAVSFMRRPTNGWDIWECRFPGTKHWLNIGEIRRHNEPAEEPEGDIF